MSLSHANPGPARLLWDRAGLWGLMTLETCWAQGLRLWPISAAEVAAGGLAGARLLVVPGGWPSLKHAALGRAGRQAVRDFVAGGGSYLGFCGGAGLALGEADGLGLLPLGRERGGGRVPSLNGPVLVRPAPGAAQHPLWQGLAVPARLFVWWPGQFGPCPPEGIRPLALYQGPTPELYSSDLKVKAVGGDWDLHENDYGLNLNPAALWGRPAVVGASYGQGRVVASYLHLDTPSDAPGGRALANLWEAWLGPEGNMPPRALLCQGTPTGPAAELAVAAREVFDLGRDMGLWAPRSEVMPLWQRGARGLEIWTLTRLTGAVAACARRPGAPRLDRLRELLAPVVEQAPHVLQAQASRLRGEPAAPGVEAQWFPAPRRTGGPLAALLEALEEAVLSLLNQGSGD
ncbi:MAG: hypothetical protein KQJ78_01710 [Deltaproteobacteria bacterium]|nr:hypothetical protein [Deltaproteobacteria bacterium]